MSFCRTLKYLHINCDSTVVEEWFIMFVDVDGVRSGPGVRAGKNSRSLPITKQMHMLFHNVPHASCFQGSCCHLEYCVGFFTRWVSRYKTLQLTISEAPDRALERMWRNFRRLVHHSTNMHAIWTVSSYIVILKFVPSTGLYRHRLWYNRCRKMVHSVSPPPWDQSQPCKRTGKMQNTRAISPLLRSSFFLGFKQ